MKLQKIINIVDSNKNRDGSFVILTDTEQKVSAAARKVLGGNLRKITARAVVVYRTHNEYAKHLEREANKIGLPMPEIKESWHKATTIPYIAAKRSDESKLYLKTFPKADSKAETYYVLPDGSQASYEDIEQYLTPSQRRDYKPASMEAQARRATMIRLISLDNVLELTPLSETR